MPTPSHLTAPSFTDPSPRARLLRASVSVFTEKGYAAASVREICERAGVTKPVLYYHFRNKEGVFRAIIQSALQYYTHRLKELSSFRGRCRERIVTIFEAIYDLYLEHFEIPQLMMSVLASPNQGIPIVDLQQFHTVFEEAVYPILQEGVARGELKEVPVQHLFAALVGCLHLAMDEQLHAACRSPRIRREDLRPILDLVFSGVCAPSNPKETP